MVEEFLTRKFPSLCKRRKVKYVVALGIIVTSMVLGVGGFLAVDAAPALASALPIEFTPQLDFSANPYAPRSTETLTRTFLPFVLCNYSPPDSRLTTVQFNSGSYSVHEGAGTATIIVTLGATSTLPVAVDYATSDGTATAGDDYTATSGRLAFAPGQTSQTFTVTVYNDTFDEPDKTLDLTLSDPVNAALGTPSTATLTIVDDDEPPKVQFGSATYSTGEGAGTATVIATLSTASWQTVTVDYVTIDGTATAGDDYTAVSGTLTFVPGDTSETLDVTILDDTFDEPDETLDLTLSNPVSATLGTPSTATLTIVDDDELPTAQFNGATYSAGEGAGRATVIATLSAPSWQTVTVDYATSDGTATGGDDYTATNGTLVFAPGQTSRSFDVAILDDGIDEPDETVILTLSNPANGTLGTPHTVTLMIVDDDEPPEVQFSGAAYSAGEGAGTATVSATLSAASWQTVTVDYATSDPSTGSGQAPATAGSDYAAASGTLTFAPGDTSETFAVTILDDTFDEPDEMLTLTLSNPANGTLGTPHTATLTIVDDDEPPTVQFSSATYSVGEGAGTATVSATLNAVSWQTVTVAYATSDPSTGSGQVPAAEAGSDYTTASGTLIFAPGQTNRTFDVTINDDTSDEPDEMLDLTLSNPVNATLGTPHTATLTIVDDDEPPTVQFNGAAYSVGEGAGTAMVSATLSAASWQTVTVDYATSDGTAEAPGDYAAASGTLTFAPGDTSETFAVTINDDTYDEPDEMLVLTLSDPVSGTLGTPPTATLTIVDDDEPPEVQFGSATYSVGEGAGTAMVIATLNTASAVPVTVDYATNDGTATAGDDYTAANGTLVFAPGQTSRVFTVTILDDGIDEPDETLTLTLSNPVAATLGTPPTATLTIVDSISLTVQFSSAAFSGGENAGTATAIATLGATSTLPVTVTYSTGDPSTGSGQAPAEAGSDYTATNGTLVFAPGQTSRTFDVTILDDGIDEPDETVILTLSDPVNTTLGTPSTATLTIVDDDEPPEVQFSGATYSVGEGAGTATVSATLSAASAMTVTVDYATSDPSASSGQVPAEAGSDYIAANGTLVFAPGQTSRIFDVTILDDGIDEPDETVNLALSNPAYGTLGTPHAATLTIVDDDGPPTVQFSGAAYSVGEGAGTATVSATLSGASWQTVTVDYVTSNGTAEAGSDYTAASGTLTFAPGQTSRVFTVMIFDDECDESNETVNLALSDPINATLGTPPTATLTIVDDDEPPTVQFSGAMYSVGEGAGAVMVIATLSAASWQTVTVDYATSDGAAEAGSDYIAASGTLAFVPGQTSRTFDVTILDDTYDEPDETLDLTLNNPANGTLGTPHTATLTIVDDDVPPAVQFSSAAYSVGEGAGTAMVLVNLSIQSAMTVTVDYATADPPPGSAPGVAKAGDDYTAVSGTLTFAPGDTSETFDVTILDDTFDEPDETLDLTLNNPANGTLGTPPTATLTIVDDDVPPAVQFSSAAYSVGEGAGTAMVLVNLSTQSAMTVTVDYATADPPPGSAPGVAKAGDDYTAVSGTLTFAPGETSETFDVTILDDTYDEPDETLLLTLSNPVSATLGTPHTATLTIVDDDEPAAVQFSSAAYSVGEGAGTATVIATLNAPSWQTVTVDYATSDGTAEAGSDYTAISGTLTFVPGDTSETFDVTILDDTYDEPDEMLDLTLNNPASATLGTPHTATLTIVDDDEPPAVQFSGATYSVGEGAGTATVIATLNGASAMIVTVDYATSDGTATAGDDYTAASGTLSFAPGDTSETFDVTILDDTFDEPDETINLALNNPANATLGTPSAATLTIVDDDVPPGASSPFALQIAALHQVAPDAMQLKNGAIVRPQTEAELLALYGSTLAALTDALSASGAGWARVRVEWEMIEPDPPQLGQPPDYIWGPYHDVKLRLVAETGVRLIATVVDAPAWAASVPCAPIYPDRLDEFAQFLTDLVNRYKEPPYNIKHWELINEPDYTKSNGHEGGLGCWGYHGDEYAQMLPVAYAAIKAADPAATVLMGGVAHDWFTEIGGPFYRYFPDDVMGSGGGAYVDVINFHYFPDFHAEWERWDPSSPDRYYGWLPAPTCGDIYDGAGTQYEAWGIDLVAKATHFRNRMSACFGLNKPVWITELAEHGYPGDPDSLANQARYVIKGYTRGLAAGVENITWYSLDRPPYDPYYQSLLYDDFSPKPAFYAYQTLTGELAGYGYSHDLNNCAWVNCVVEAYVFENVSQQEKTVAWGSGTLVFAPANQLRVVDRAGSVTIIVDGGAGDVDGTQNGAVELQLSAEPVFVSVQ